MPGRLLLMRHGQIKANRVGRWHGSTDSALTLRGRRQAKRASEFLAHRHPQIDAVYSSPLQRCMNTARLAVNHMPHLDIQSSDGLREMSIGEWENLPFKELHEEFNLIRKLSNDPQFRPPEGETVAEVSIRVCEALREIDAAHTEDEVILVVSHGVAVAIALGALLNNNPCKWREYQQDNCSISEITLTPELLITKFNQTTQ